VAFELSFIKDAFLKLKNGGGMKVLIRAAFLMAALALPGITFGDDDAHKMPNMPSMGPVTIPDLSLPLDCKSVDDELARINKFSHNPKATKTQLNANANRASKLEAKRKKLQCQTVY
jgi:hypothetical protein